MRAPRLSVLFRAFRGSTLRKPNRRFGTDENAEESENTEPNVTL
jgi:hypothetical protein